MDLLPGSIVAPTAENSVDGLPIREVVRKESPSEFQCGHFEAALTIAMVPRRIASGSLAQPR